MPERITLAARVAVLLAAALAALTGCGRSPESGAASAGSGAREIRIVAREDGGKMYFEPAAITVKAGERVVFVVENQGTQDHEFEGEEAGIEEIVVPPGKSRKLEWAAPNKAGEYEFVCDLPGHKEAGMVGKIQVTP